MEQEDTQTSQNDFTVLNLPPESLSQVERAFDHFASLNKWYGKRVIKTSSGRIVSYLTKPLSSRLFNTGIVDILIRDVNDQIEVRLVRHNLDGNEVGRLLNYIRLMLSDTAGESILEKPVAGSVYKNTNISYLAWMVLCILVLSVLSVVGISYIQNVKSAKVNQINDSIRLCHVSKLQYALEKHYENNKSYPSNIYLDPAFTQYYKMNFSSETELPKDPITHDHYEYFLLQPTRYRLVAYSSTGKKIVKDPEIDFPDKNTLLAIGALDPNTLVTDMLYKNSCSRLSAIDTEQKL